MGIVQYVMLYLSGMSSVQQPLVVQKYRHPNRVLILSSIELFVAESFCKILKMVVMSPYTPTF